MVHSRVDPMKTEKREKYPFALAKAAWHNLRKSKRERPPVTICVAAICKGYAPNEQLYAVVGAADRMITSGDIEFEPEHVKIVRVTNSVFLLLAGDSALQTEIIQGLWKVVHDRITAEPQNWWKVKDI